MITEEQKKLKKYWTDVAAGRINKKEKKNNSNSKKKKLKANSGRKELLHKLT